MPPKDQFVYVKIHLHTNQGVETLSQQEAETLTGKDPDAFTRDLFDSIALGNYPSWDVFAQIIPPDQAEKYSVDKVNIFDPTKTWPKCDWPLINFGKITLNRNPETEFGEVEQVSFNPTAIVPGWDVSADPSTSYPSISISIQCVNFTLLGNYKESLMSL